MRDVANAYTTVVYENLHPLYANWKPSQPVRLGDYGLLSGRLFVYVGNIRSHGIKFVLLAEMLAARKPKSSRGIPSVSVRGRSRRTADPSM
jgi:hypothetical protein